MSASSVAPTGSPPTADAPTISDGWVGARGAVILSMRSSITAVRGESGDDA
jgi:hypothetical protein